MNKVLLRLWAEELAQDLVEYVLVGTLIGLVALGSVKSLSNRIKNEFSNSAKILKSAAKGGGGGNTGGNNNGGDNND